MRSGTDCFRKFDNEEGMTFETRCQAPHGIQYESIYRSCHFEVVLKLVLVVNCSSASLE